MRMSSGQNLTRTTCRNCVAIIFLSFICIAWNTVNAQSATHISTTATDNSDHYASTETAHEFSRPTFSQATKYIYEKVEQRQHRWASDISNYRNIRQQNVKTHSSQENKRTEYGAQQSHGRGEKLFGQSPLASETSCESLKFACDATQDIWRMLTPSTLSFEQREQKEDDSDSVDEALEHIRGIIHILGQTHNALLENKIANLPFFQKLWVKYLLFYKEPYFAESTASRTAKFRKALSDFFRSDGSFNRVVGNYDSIKETIMEAFAKQMLQSVSALKESLRKTVQEGWLMLIDVHPYVEKVTQTFNALSVRLLHKMTSLAEATGPISDRIPSHEQIRHFIKGVEDTITDFKEELWRSRTEWMYQRGEALSWAREKADDFKRRAARESDRVTKNLNIWVQSTKRMLKGNLERSREALETLAVIVGERTERLIVLLQLRYSDATRFIGNCSRRFVLFVSNSWKILASIAVIILFRSLLGFVLTDDYDGSVIASTSTSSGASNSANHRSKTAASRQPETPAASSPTRSETSDSRPKQKSLSSQRKSPPNTSKPSRVRGPTPQENNRPVKHRVQRRERRTVAKSGNDRTQKQTKPLQVSNVQHQDTFSSLEKQMNGRPIHLGDHEVQLVYEDVPRDGANDAQGNRGVASRTPVDARTKRLHGTSRRGDKQPVRTENGDDVITVNSSDESTTSYGSANSRLTRGSLRRGSARQSQAR